MAHGSLKRPLEPTESNVLVSPPMKTSKLGDVRAAVMVNYSREEMASRDWWIFTQLPLEDKSIFIEKLQWQRVVNMRMFMDVIHLHNSTPEFRLISADLTRRGIDASKSNWKWNDPLPLLPGYFPHEFPPFQSFTAANTSLEEEFITITRICAQTRGKTLHASAEQSAATNPKASSEGTVQDFTALSPLVLRTETRCERERLLMDMAASRLFTLKFSTGSSLGSSRYDLVTDAILWSVDFTFYLNTSAGSKHETFVVDDTSERDTLKPNIDNIICFDDVDNSITAEFKKSADRSENCFNVFFVVPHVIDVNTEAQYYLIDHNETLLNAIRGKLVIDRPRFLVALKSQSVHFIRKAANLEGTAKKAQCKPQLQAIPLSSGPQSSTMNFNLPPPSIQIPIFPAQQSMQPPPCVSIGMGSVPPTMMLPSFGCPSLPLPPFLHGTAPPMPAVVPQPAPVISRPNLVVLTSNSQTVQSTPIPTKDTAVVLLPITVEKGSGTKFTPSEMAKRDEEKLVKCNWEVQKALLFKLPLNRVLNLFFHMRGRVRGNPRLNNMFSLLPTRFRNAGIAKIPSGWTLKDELPMLSGYQPLTGIIPITEFEIDEVADDANFEQVAKTVETVIMKARPVVPPASSEANSSNTSKTNMPTSRQTIYGKVKSKIDFSPSEMAYWDYTVLKSTATDELASELYKLDLARLLNLAFHMTRYPVRATEGLFPTQLKSRVFTQLSRLGVDGIPDDWELGDPVPVRPNFTAKPLPIVKKTFHVIPHSLYKAEHSWEMLTDSLSKDVEMSGISESNRPLADVAGSTDASAVGGMSSALRLPPTVGLLLKKAHERNIRLFVNAGERNENCKCFYASRKDTIRWTVHITLEVYKNSKWQEESFYSHDVDAEDSIQAILGKVVTSASRRKRSLAEDFEKAIRNGVVADVEMYMVSPVIVYNKMILLRRTKVNQDSSLGSLIRNQLVYECPTFVAWSKVGLKASHSKRYLIELNPPVVVVGYSPERSDFERPSSPKSVLPKNDNTPWTTIAANAVQEKRTAFTLTPSQVAASDSQTLTGLSCEDQKLLVALMPWERVVTLALYLRSKDDECSKNLLILCNLRLEKLGIGPLPERWTTLEKIPTLPGYSSSCFVPFSKFEMVEVPFFTKTLVDVKKVAEKLSSLKTSLNVSEESERLFLGFEPRNERERQLISEIKARGIYFAFSIDAVSDADDRSHYDTASKSVSWTVEVTFAATIERNFMTETVLIHDVLETTSLAKVARLAVQKLSEHAELIERFRLAIIDDGTRFIDILYIVPRIPTAKLDLERYQRTRHARTLRENLEDKIVVNRPKFLVILKDQSTKFSSKFITSAQENSLTDFVLDQKLLSRPKTVEAQHLNLFDHLYNYLSKELIHLKENDAGAAKKKKEPKSTATAVTLPETAAKSPLPYELAVPVNFKYGAKTVIQSRELTFSDMKDAEDMVAMAMHRKRDEVITPLQSSRAETFISRVAQYWGFRVKEIVTVEAATTRMVVYFEGLSRLVTLAQCQHSAITSATAGAYSGVMAALCYMLVVPFEMWNVVATAASDEWIDAVIYACRHRFAHLVLMNHSAEFLKLSDFNENFDSPISDDMIALWQRFIHKMRHSGIRFWGNIRDVRIPYGVKLPDLSSYRGTYFRFTAFEGIIDWAVMNPIMNKVETSDIASCEPTVFDRFSEQVYERGLLPPRTENPEAHRCPVTGAENWHESITALPDDPLVQITARDCETRGDEPCIIWQTPINHTLIEEIGRRFKWKVVYTHLLQWESNGQFANLFHLVNVKFENIAPFFLQGLGKHVSFRRAWEIADSFIVSSLCRMGVIPLEMYDLLREIGEEWIDPVLYSCQERFAAFLRLSKNPTFFELNTLANAELSAANPDKKNFVKAYAFARCIRDSALRYWSDHQLVLVHRSIRLPQDELAGQFFTFANIESFEKWDEVFASTTEFDHYDKNKLMSFEGKVPPWEKSKKSKEKSSSAALSIDAAYKKIRDAAFDADDVDSLRRFMDSMAMNVSCKIRTDKRMSRTKEGYLLYYCDVRFSDDTGKFLYGRAASKKESLAYERAVRALYANLLNCAFVLPSLDEFVARSFRKSKGKDKRNDRKDDLPLDRIPYVARAIRPLLQRFAMVIRRYRGLVTGCDEATKKLRSEQLLSLIRRLNESWWGSHTVLLPFNIFVDHKDSENCRQLLQPFFEVLQPDTIWIGNVKVLQNFRYDAMYLEVDNSALPGSTKKNPYYACEYALTAEDLQAEKVTVSCEDIYGVVEEEKSSDNSSLHVKEKAAEEEKSSSDNSSLPVKEKSVVQTEKSAQSETTTENLMANKDPDVFDPFTGSGRKVAVAEQPAIKLPWQVEPPDSGDTGEYREDDEEDEYLD